MIDRSQFIEELKQHPELLHRIAVITAGEVSGSAPLEKQILQAETIFNRAMARGITLEQATRQVGQGNPDGKQGGYYPASTFSQGEESLRRAGGDQRFFERVLKPVMDGSDVGTKTLGFAPTGNASEGTNRFASSRAASGKYYDQYKWHPDGKEMYVVEKGDSNGRIDAKRTGTQPDNWRQATGAPPPPNQQPPGPQPSGQPDILAPVGAPGDPRRAPLYGPGAGGAAPATATATAQPRQGLAGALSSFFGGGKGSTGYAPSGRETYKDPTTGHTILNPGGPGRSGEEAMGITRDLGARPSQAAPRPAAPGPRTRAPMGPPDGSTEEAPPPSAGPRVTQNTAVPDILAPTLRTDERRLVPYELPKDLNVPSTPPESTPVATNENQMQRDAALSRDKPVTIADLLGSSAAPSSAAAAPAAPASIFNPNPTSQTVPPDLTGLKPAPAPDAGGGIMDKLFGPKSPDWHLPVPPGRPMTTTEQLFGLGFRNPQTSPSGGPASVPPPGSATLGASPRAPDAARALAPFGAPPMATVPSRYEDPSAASSFGGTRPLPLSPFTTGVNLNPPRPQPAPSQRPELPSEQFNQATNPAEADAAMARSRSAAGIGPQAMNLSPFQQWPPPWWDVGGGGGYGGGGGGFGGGGGYGDFGAFA